MGKRFRRKKKGDWGGEKGKMLENLGRELATVKKGRIKAQKTERRHNCEKYKN